jgi:hypothetical protein
VSQFRRAWPLCRTTARSCPTILGHTQRRCGFDRPPKWVYNPLRQGKNDVHPLWTRQFHPNSRCPHPGGGVGPSGCRAPRIGRDRCAVSGPPLRSGSRRRCLLPAPAARNGGPGPARPGRPRAGPGGLPGRPRRAPAAVGRGLRHRGPPLPRPGPRAGAHPPLARRPGGRPAFRCHLLPARRGRPAGGGGRAGGVPVPVRAEQRPAPFLRRYAAALAPLVNLETWYRPYCPVCGGEPDFAALDKPHGARRLLCSRCDFEWPFRRTSCPFCGNDKPEQYLYVPSEDGIYRLYLCDRCRRYLKVIDRRELVEERLLPVERILTLPMDQAARQEGYG